MGGKRRSPSRIRNLFIVGLIGQVGFVTVTVIMLALLAGLWLDAQIGVKGLFTVLLLVLSVPLTVYVIMRIALRAARSIAFSLPDADDVSETQSIKED